MFFIRIFVIVLFSFAPGMAFASDGSPEPTTSPTNSGKATKAEINQFVEARKSIFNAVENFDALAAKSGKTPTSKQAAEMKTLLKEINAQAAIVKHYTLKIGDNNGEKLAGQLIIDDDITGKQATVKSTAQLLKSISDKLGLLEPVVYR